MRRPATRRPATRRLRPRPPSSEPSKGRSPVIPGAGGVPCSFFRARHDPRPRPRVVHSIDRHAAKLANRSMLSRETPVSCLPGAARQDRGWARRSRASESGLGMDRSVKRVPRDPQVLRVRGRGPHERDVIERPMLGTTRAHDIADEVVGLGVRSERAGVQCGCGVRRRRRGRPSDLRGGVPVHGRRVLGRARRPTAVPRRDHGDPGV